MPINKFTTLLDLSRQAKIITGETATFDGKILSGIPFSGYPTGVNTATTVSLGVVSTENAVFSGNTGTTVFDVSNPLSPYYDPLFSGYTAFTWTNPLFSATTSGLTLPITILSADTQVVGPFWTLTQTGYTGDYIIGTEYTGYSVTYSFFTVSQFNPGVFSGVTSASQENFSAGTLDYKGPLDYLSSKENISVDGRLITNKITISNGASSATTNYVLSQIDDTGKGGWNSISSLLSGSCLPIVNLETINDCSSGITFNSDVIINGDVIVNGSATTINTEIIRSKDNNIILNYSGTHLTAIGGGITLEDGVSNGVDSRIYSDSNGVWLFDPSLSANSGTIINFSADTIGSSGDCVNDLYVSNIHSCSPLNINPLNEGDVYFGSTSGVTIDVTNSRVGIGTDSPNYPLQILGGNSTFYYDPTSLGGDSRISGNTNLPRYTVSIAPYLTKPSAGGQFGMRCWDDATSPNYGKVGDTFMYAGNASNGLNLINSPGTGTNDYIRFYAGTNATSTPSMHIQGSGTTKGYVGINTSNPQYLLDIVNTNSRLFYDPTSVGGRFSISGKTNVPRFGVEVPPYLTKPLASASLGIRAWDDLLYPDYGNPGDVHLYAGVNAYGLNIISEYGATSADYIRFYAGQDASSVNTPDIHIQGSGVTRGYVGIGTSSPTERLTVSGKTKTTTLQVTSGATNGYLLVSDSIGNATWQSASGATSGVTFWTASTGVDAIVVKNSGSVASGLLSLGQGYQTTASGDYSHAEGYLTISTGFTSHAEGNITQSLGNYSHSEGNGAIAIGISSHAEGANTQAIGDQSHSEGANTQAIGNSSHAEGGNTQAIGNSSHAEGYQTTASGDFSHSEGYYNIASGTASHAEGGAFFGKFGLQSSPTSATTYSSHAEGISTLASGDYSHAEGYQTTSSGNGSHAEGYFTQSIGENSHAEGYQTTSSGTSSHAEGVNTLSLGQFSHAEGDNTTASGTSSHAEGQNTTSNGLNSHAEGQNTTSNGDGSHAEGESTTSSGDYSHSEGYYNIASGTASHAEGGAFFGKFGLEDIPTSATTYSSHAEGIGTLASGQGSHAEGYQTTASGDFSHSEGYQTSATTFYSHAEGISTTASGNYSHAEGSNTTASGDYSHAEGISTTASTLSSHAEGDLTLSSGAGSHAEGYQTSATTFYSHAEGISTTASGNYSHSEGAFTIAGGIASHAEGDLTLASGNGSHSEGVFTISSGIGSHAEGFQTSATTSYSHAEGADTLASGFYSHSEGYGNISSGVASHAEGGAYFTISVNSLPTSATSYSSHAEGVLTLASGQGSHSEGVGNISSGNFSHAEGGSNISSGEASHAEGGSTISSGNGSHSEGLSTISSGDYSHAEGGNTLSLGQFSHAEGDNTTSSGDYSHAEGWGTIAYETFQHVSGRFNTTGNTNQYFIIGRGTNNASRSNAFRVDSAGNVYGAGATYNSGADYAEYFESLSGDSIPYGTVVELVDDKIKVCEDSNNAMGVISSNPTIIGNNEGGTADEWVGKYEKDEWGKYIMEDYQFEEIDYIDTSGNTFYKTVTSQRSKLSDDFDPNMIYIPRSERPEWNVVGLVGQVRVLKNQQIPIRWIKMKDINNDIALYLIR